MQYTNCIGEGRRIGGCWARSDRTDIISDHVRENECDNRCFRRGNEPASFQQREMFPYRIHLVDRCAGSEKKVCRALFIDKGYAGNRSW